MCDAWICRPYIHGLFLKSYSHPISFQKWAKKERQHQKRGDQKSENKPNFSTAIKFSTQFPILFSLHLFVRTTTERSINKYERGSGAGCWRRHLKGRRRLGGTSWDRSHRLLIHVMHWKNPYENHSDIFYVHRVVYACLQQYVIMCWASCTFIIASLGSSSPFC